jgi:predicted porin
VNWNRYGVSARASYQMVDLYAAYAVDRINHVPSGVNGTFDATATGLTLGADTYVTNATLLSFRYDNLDAGGMIDQRTSATFLGIQARQYLRTNVSIFVRNDVNLRKAEGGETAARNLRNAFFAGIDLVF